MFHGGEVMLVKEYRKHNYIIYKWRKLTHGSNLFLMRNTVSHHDSS